MEEERENSPIKQKKSFSIKLKSYIRNLFDFSSYDAKTIMYIIVFIILFDISLYLLYYIYFVDQSFLNVLVIE